MPLRRVLIATFALLLTLSFFMTWIQIDLGFFVRNISGSALPGQIRSLAAAGDAMSTAFGGRSSGAATQALAFYLLYIIPVGAALLAFHAVTGRRGRLSLTAQATTTGGASLLLAGLMGLLLSHLVGTDLSALLAGNGYGLTLLTSLALILTPLLVKENATVNLSPEVQQRTLHQGQQALDLTGAWLKDRQEQARTHLEATRLKNALGRRTNRDLLTPADALIAPAGTVITHHLIQQARQAGIIDLLLASVDHDRKEETPHQEPSA